MKKLFKLSTVLNAKASVLLAIIFLSAGLKIQAQPSDKLMAGQQLDPNMSLVSANGQYKLTFEVGHLALYHQQTEEWISPTFSNLVSLKMQQDAQLVLYKSAGGGGLTPVMDSDTYYQNPGETPYVELTDTGELLITKFAPDTDENGNPIYSITMVSLIPTGFRVR